MLQMTRKRNLRCAAEEMLRGDILMESRDIFIIQRCSAKRLERHKFNLLQF